MSSCPNSSIFDLCKFRDWRRVELECKREPINAQYVGDDDDSLPIHIACKKQPTVRIIRVLLKAYPQGAFTRDANGYLPIHIACLSNASIDALRALTENDPSTAALLTSSGESAMTILSLTRDTTENIVDFNNLALWQSETSELAQVNFNTLYWQKLQVIIEAVAIHQQSGKLVCVDDFFMLHAAISIGWSPADVFYFCCNQFRDQIRVRDDLGRLPLHMAVGLTSKYRSTEALASKLQIREKSIILPALLQYYPEAARCIDPTEPKGRYPLHTALVNKHEWHGGVKELLQSYPDAALLLDPVEKIYPFQLASHDVDTTFQILRKSPSVLLHFIKKRQTTITTTDSKKPSWCASNKSNKSQVSKSMKSSFHSASKLSQSSRGHRKIFTVPSLHDGLTTAVGAKPIEKENLKRERGIVEVCWTPELVQRTLSNTICVNSAPQNSSEKNPHEVVWQPPSFEPPKMEKVHSIMEITIKHKSSPHSKRRHVKSSTQQESIHDISNTNHLSLQSVDTPVMKNFGHKAYAHIDDNSNGETILSMNTSHDEITMNGSDREMKHSMHSSVTPFTECPSSDQQSSCSEPISDDNSSSSNDTSNDSCKSVRNSQIVAGTLTVDSDEKSNSSEEINDYSTSSNYRVYNKYKCLISGSDKEEDFSHGWNRDVVKSNVRKLFKQPTQEILEL